MKALPDPKTDAPALPAGNPCLKCGGRCCSFKTLNIVLRSVSDTDAILNPEERARATIRRQEAQDHSSVFRQSGEPVEMEWFLTDDGGLAFDCQHLTDEGKCGIYDDRPQLCRQFECSIMRGQMTVDEWADAHAPDGEVDTSGWVNVTDAVTDELRTIAAEQ